MARRLILFGIGEMAEVAHYYFSNYTDREVVAFTVDRSYVREASFAGLPVVPFDEASSTFPPDAYDLFVAVGYSRLNQVRRAKYLEARNLGYRLASYVSRDATILNEGRIGDNCFILEDNTIQPFATIGNNVVLWSGNHIGHHSYIGDHCFLASHIVVSGGVRIGSCCFVGVNATFRDHITVGESCLIGAGAMLLADAEPKGVYAAAATERSPIPSNRLRKI
jgi:sugar O-acyltransferase (sialic acid O-acetyltransferase NeuD family)